MIVTPHLGASTAEATDRAGFQAAEQVVAALTGGAVTTAVNVPAVAPRTSRCSARSSRCAVSSAGWRSALAEGSSVDRIEVEFLGRIAERDTRPLGVAVLLGVLSGNTEEEVNAGQRAGASPGRAASRSWRPTAPMRATSPT